MIVTYVSPVYQPLANHIFTYYDEDIHDILVTILDWLLPGYIPSSTCGLYMGYQSYHQSHPYGCG
jgi:hypothetical protein